MPSEWHCKWQRDISALPSWRSEVGSRNDEQWYKIADLESEKLSLVIEVQHSPISATMVAERDKHHDCRNVRVLWLLDGMLLNAACQQFESHWLLSIPRPRRLASFSDCDFVLLDLGVKGIFSLRPKDVKRGFICCYWRFTRERILEILQCPTPLKQLDPGLPIPPRLFLFQDPPGSGKTFRLIRRCVYPHDPSLEGVQEEQSGAPIDFGKYRTFLFGTKPHSAKEVVWKEFKEQIHDLEQRGLIYEYKEEELTKGYWCTFRRRDDNAKIVCWFSTVDSFLWALHPARGDDAPNPIQGQCNAITREGPTRLSTKDGSVIFKGQKLCMRQDTLICWDECTKLEEMYLDTLLRIQAECGADACLSGDLLQSIEYDDNLFVMAHRKEVQRHYGLNVVERAGNSIRRFGPTLVDFVNSIVDWSKWGLQKPVAAKLSPGGSVCVRGLDSVSSASLSQAQENEEEEQPSQIASSGEGTAKVDADSELALSVADRLMDDLNTAIDEMLLLPNEVLVIFPFVSSNPVANILERNIHDLWYKRCWSPLYQEWRDKVLSCRGTLASNYFDRVTSGEIGNFAILHRSEEGKPVNTATSASCTRLVSIHSSQGDGRRLAMVVGLAEWKLLRFSKGSTRNLIFDSLINVSITRATERLCIYIDRGHDAVWRRFKPYLGNEYATAPPNLRPHNMIRLLELDVNSAAGTPFGKVEGLATNCRDMVATRLQESQTDTFDANRVFVEFEHHVVRPAAYHLAFIMGLLCHDQRSLAHTQVMAKLRQLRRLPIARVPDVRVYNKLLAGVKTISGWKLETLPLWQKPSVGEAVHSDIFRCLQEIRKWVDDIQSNNVVITPAWERSPKHWVLLHHVFEIAQKGLYAHTPLDIVFKIFSKSKERLESFYVWLTNAYTAFDKTRQCLSELTGTEKHTWQVCPKWSLGAKDRDNNFDYRLIVETPFLAYDGKSDTVIPIIIIPRLDGMNAATNGARLLLIQMSLQQPLSGKYVTKAQRTPGVMVVSQESMANPVFFDLQKEIQRSRQPVLRWIANEVYTKCLENHESILAYVVNQGSLRTAEMKYPKDAKHTYISNAFRDLRSLRDSVIKEDEEPYTTFRKTLHTTLGQSVEDLLDVLDGQASQDSKRLKTDT